MAVKIIGITGKARAGKDTVGKIVCDTLPNCHWYALAMPIKDALFGMLGVDDPSRRAALMVNKEEAIPYLGVSPRQILQDIGKAMRDSAGEDFWLHFLQQHLDVWSSLDSIYETPTTTYIVITDVRYDNEAKFIKERGGAIWRVTRPDAAKVRDHESERGISDEYVDVEIDNSKAIEQLEQKVKQLLKENYNND